MAMKPTQPKLGGFGNWDPRMFGNMMRPFNQREMTEGYLAHSCVGWMEDHQGNQALPTKSVFQRVKRGYGIFILFWAFGWSEYFCHMGHKTPGCPWSTHYDPSRERAFQDLIQDYSGGGSAWVKGALLH